jgi:hypothetical protein
MFEITTQGQIDQEQTLKDNEAYVSSFYINKHSETPCNKHLEHNIDSSSQYTIQLQQNTLFDKSFASKNGNYVDITNNNNINTSSNNNNNKNGTMTPHKKKRIKKKRVKFNEPFLDYVNVESLKEFNLKMTYIEYDDEQEVLTSTKECCTRLSKCIII